jgi:hypothetical protein
MYETKSYGVVWNKGIEILDSLELLRNRLFYRNFG